MNLNIIAHHLYHHLNFHWQIHLNRMWCMILVHFQFDNHRILQLLLNQHPILVEPENFKNKCKLNEFYSFYPKHAIFTQVNVVIDGDGGNDNCLFSLASVSATCKCSYLRPRKNRSNVKRTAISVFRNSSTA